METVSDAFPLADASKVVQVAVECHHGHWLILIVTFGTVWIMYNVHIYFITLGVGVARRQRKGNQEDGKECVFHGRITIR